MAPMSREACSRLSEQFADIFQECQEDYRSLLSDLRDDAIDVGVFSERAEALMDRLVKLKRIRLQISRERTQLLRQSRKAG